AGPPAEGNLQPKTKRIEIRPVLEQREGIEERQEKLQAAVRGRPGEEEGNPDDFDRDFFAMRVYPGTKIPPGARAAALNTANLNNGGLVGGPGEPTSPSDGLPQATWAPVGPSNIVNGQTDRSFPGTPATPVSGRLTAIAVHPTNPSIVYAGGAQGGVW